MQTQPDNVSAPPKPIGARPRWFVATPIPFDPSYAGFWFRDLGALCLEFRRLGIDSQFVVLAGPKGRNKDQPVILCTPEEMASAAWWRQWNVDGVIFNSWAAPRLAPVARAIKEAGARLVLRLDTDGVKSPRLKFLPFLSNSYFAARDVGQRLPALFALAKTLVYRVSPSSHDRKMCDHLSLADYVTVESAQAHQYLERLLRILNRADLVAKLRVVPQFATVERGYGAAEAKKPVIVAVGRWDAWQKDGPKLVRVLGRALERRTDYTAMIIGGGREFLEPRLRQLPTSVRQRVELTGLLPHEQVQQHCRQARLMLFTSRFEGFPFAASEALCCGCTVVGPVSLPSIGHIATCGGGTVAVSRSDQDLCDAVAVEMMAWDQGWRDPAQISRWWMAHLSVSAVARQLMEIANVAPPV